MLRAEQLIVARLAQLWTDVKVSADRGECATAHHRLNTRVPSAAGGGKPPPIGPIANVSSLLRVPARALGPRIAISVAQPRNAGRARDVFPAALVVRKMRRCVMPGIVSDAGRFASDGWGCNLPAALRRTAGVTESGPNPSSASPIPASPFRLGPLRLQTRTHRRVSADTPEPARHTRSRRALGFDGCKVLVKARAVRTMRWVSARAKGDLYDVTSALPAKGSHPPNAPGSHLRVMIEYVRSVLPARRKENLQTITSVSSLLPQPTPRVF